MGCRQSRVRDLQPQLIVLGDPIEVLIEGQGLERTSQHRGANGEVATLQAADRGPGHEHPRGHLRLAHPAATPSGSEPRSESLSASLRIRMERLTWPAHDTYY